MVSANLVIDGPAASHDLTCWMCGKNSAVFDLNDNVFQPCWECQGYYIDANMMPQHKLAIVREPTRWERLALAWRRLVNRVRH